MTHLVRAALLAATVSATLSAQAPAPQRLDTIRVTSRIAPDAGAAQRSVEFIGREAIDRLPARTVTDLLEMALGADVQRRSPAQADLAIRGSSLGQVLVLVNGVRVSDLQTGHFDLDLAVPLDAVARIEILRGPGATLYGPDAIGGVVNVVTRQGEPWTRARIHGGSFGTVGGGLGSGASIGSSGTTVVQVSGDAERSSGHRDGADYEIMQATAGVTSDVGTGSLAFEVGLAARDFGAADFYAPAPSFERTRSQTAALRLASGHANGWRGSAALSTRRHSDDFILRRNDPAFYRNRHTSWQHAIELSARRAIRDHLGIAIGAEGLEASLASERLGDRREQRIAGFGELTLGTARSANVSAGVRVDHSTTLRTFASPTIAASLPLHRLLRLRGSAARGLRAPSWTERHYRDPANTANPDLGPERFWAAELGARATPSWGFVDAAAFIRRATDLIDWVRPVDAPPTTPWTTANLEAATYRGVEAGVTVPDVAGFGVGLTATELAFEAAAADTVIGKYALRPLTRVLGARLDRALGSRLRLSVDARHARRAREAGYTLAHVRTAYRVGALTAHLDLTNLLGASYLDASGRAAAGRALVAGVSYR